MNYIINFTEAQDEARRLSKVLKRGVEVNAVDCTCDYSRECFICGGSGTWYDLVFGFCSHSVGDGEQVECDQAGCAEREREAALVEKAETFPRVGAPLQSCREIEEAERERQIAGVAA